MRVKTDQNAQFEFITPVGATIAPKMEPELIGLAFKREQLIDEEANMF